MKKKLFCLAAALTFGAGVAHAGCVDTFGIGAKAAAMGGAYSAYADDPFAVYYNPAGLTQIDRPTLAAGVHLIDPSIKLKNIYVEGAAANHPLAGFDLQAPNTPTFDNQASVSDDAPLLIAPHLGFAMPITDRIAFGVGVYAPFGLEVEFPKDPAVNPLARSSYHSYYNRKVINPTVAYKVNERLSLGFGVSVGMSESGAEVMRWVPNPALGPNGGSYQHIKVELKDDVNYSFNLGVMYRPTDTVTLGLTYRSETDADFEGDVFENGRKVAKTTLDYNHPQQVQAGVRYTPHDRVSLQMDMVWTEWSINQHQVEPLTHIAAGSLFDTYGINEISSQRRWENTRQLRFGGEFIVNDLLTLRAGYFYDPSPIPDRTLDTMWPDADKKTYSFGAGFNIGQNMTIDTILQYTAIEQTRQVGGESVNLNKAFEVAGLNDPRVHARADGHLLGAGITFTYRF
ncbi:outer membrane protein transport protein [Desulfobotulus sp. H1]|uniref:Outer membrane protein transport protein n=1 Tax=Desulfobotulus pelophilus TaxID=2823377 RepID=A0ABT3NAX3_9BACT|nr:outer membrane protein transport protein [Desulfobotulus pelophilus]MCW7754611.1 outer membrane protein transport protein [Desulfobotulus pelophilus]